MLLAQTAQIREADRIQIEDRNLPGILLMEQAGRLSAEAIRARYPERRSALILAGPGNNGGDGLVIARYLLLAGWEVQVLLSHDPARYAGDALINYRIIAELPVPLLRYEEEDLDEVLASFRQPPVLVDALLGTGIRSELRGPVAEILAALRGTPLPVVAIDLPSGLSADTGEAINEVLPADFTLTFQLPKVCHHVTPAALACGEVVVLDIGIWPEVIVQLGIRREVLDLACGRAWYRPRRRDGHKGSYGHALLVGGSRPMAGAMVLSSEAALAGGAGLVTVLAPGSVRLPLLAQAPELMCRAFGDEACVRLDEAAVGLFDEALRGKAAVAIGPGLGTHPDTGAFLESILPRVQVPLVLDADALNLLAEHPHWWATLPEATILTPHPGEMKRLTGLANVNTRRLEAAERLATDRNAIVILKGAGT
ncbi:MAG: NAD(P)H-hydrate epimerase, partial [Bacteroidetes bacterium]